MPEPFAIYDRRTRTIVHTCATPHEVALWLWGRSYLRYVLYQGECPYYFNTPNLTEVEFALEHYPVPEIRTDLPARVLHGMTPTDLEILCWIGGTDPRPEEPPPCPK